MEALGIRGNVEAYPGNPDDSGRGGQGRHHAQHDLTRVDVLVKYTWRILHGEIGGGHLGTPPVIPGIRFIRISDPEVVPLRIGILAIVLLRLKYLGG